MQSLYRLLLRLVVLTLFALNVSSFSLVLYRLRVGSLEGLYRVPFLYYLLAKFTSRFPVSETEKQPTLKHELLYPAGDCLSASSAIFSFHYFWMSVGRKRTNCFFCMFFLIRTYCLFFFLGKGRGNHEFIIKGGTIRTTHEDKPSKPHIFFVKDNKIVEIGYDQANQTQKTLKSLMLPANSFMPWWHWSTTHFTLQIAFYAATARKDDFASARARRTLAPAALTKPYRFRHRPNLQQSLLRCLSSMDRDWRKSPLKMYSFPYVAILGWDGPTCCPKKVKHTWSKIHWRKQLLSTFMCV